MRQRYGFWAVEMRDELDTWLAGIAWFTQADPETPGLDGPREALFSTREAARGAIKAKGLERYQARAVRVVCSVRKVR